MTSHSVILKLERNLLHPSTPLPTSVKFLESLWKMISAQANNLCNKHCC